MDQNKSNKVTLSNIIQKLENTKKYDFFVGWNLAKGSGEGLQELLLPTFFNINAINMLKLNTLIDLTFLLHTLNQLIVVVGINIVF